MRIMSIIFLNIKPPNKVFTINRNKKGGCIKSAKLNELDLISFLIRNFSSVKITFDTASLKEKSITN